MKEFFDDIGRWVDRYGGPWGTRVLAFLVALLAYGVVWFAVTSFRALLDSIARPNPDEQRGLVILGGLIRVGVALALLVWLVRIAINDFPDWLGIDILRRP